MEENSLMPETENRNDQKSTKYLLENHFLRCLNLWFNKSKLMNFKTKQYYEKKKQLLESSKTTHNNTNKPNQIKPNIPYEVVQ